MDGKWAGDALEKRVIDDTQQDVLANGTKREEALIGHARKYQVQGTLTC